MTAPARTLSLFLGLPMIAALALGLNASPHVGEEGEASAATVNSTTDAAPGYQDHKALVEALGHYPSAAACANCHGNIYEEWSSSAHAYASISPMFNKFEQALNTLAVGTVGAFCVRCHVPVGTAVGQPREMTIFERSTDRSYFPDGSDPYVSVEGVTCIACHRVKEQYGRVNAQRRIEPKSIFEPMYGSGDGVHLKKLKDDPNFELGLDEDSLRKGLAKNPNTTAGHGSIERNDILSKSEFCVSCHQVAVHPGIKLEVVWDQYIDSPAHTRGLSCQDCHMSQDPGLPAGFEKSYKALIQGTEPIADGEIDHKNHGFVGPGYSVAHPGIFPHPVKRQFTLERMMSFNWRSPLGTEEFENALEDGAPTSEQQLAVWFGTDDFGQVDLPKSVRDKLISAGVASFTGAESTALFGSWPDASERRNARQVIDKNQQALAKRKVQRAKVMSNASALDGPFFFLDGDPIKDNQTLSSGETLEFALDIKNTCEGHNLPSGSLGAQPQLWLNVAVVAPDGTNVWETGHLDANGDLADLHSTEVLHGRIAFDDQLFNLQTRFLTTNVKGGDREMYLPVNFDVDQIPYIRPAGVPSTVLNHPPFIRMEQRSLPPLMKKRVHFTVPASAMKQPGTYTIAYRLRSRAEPIYFMNFVGSTQEMIRSMTENMVDVHTSAFTFEVH